MSGMQQRLKSTFATPSNLEKHKIDYWVMKGAKKAAGPNVGSVGLAIGGGFGFKIGQYGLACKNIVSATMVLANGVVVAMDDKHHPALLRGIKGGAPFILPVGLWGDRGAWIEAYETRSEVCMMSENIRKNTQSSTDPAMARSEQDITSERLPALVKELQARSNVQTPNEALYLYFSWSPVDGKPLITLGE
ncbi:hypothetical protein FRB96_001031 [Tulasnella sp. 330]|nr:hypothetical protein FRB96_001031 [Tulasnella sp. 330]